MTASSAPGETDRIWIARGPRAVEALLLERVGELSAAARADGRLLRDPVRIVVPSRSLADHVGERLVSSGGARAGVQVQTLFAVALEILERVGTARPALDALFPVLVRRLAAEEPLLRERLAELADGYAAVEASVADLLDAGLDADCADAICEAIASSDLYPTARERGLAVVRVAARCFEAMQKEGGGHRALLLRAACEALRADPERSLPARAVFVHGFADVTGLRADLIEELVRWRQASVLIDEPPDPARPGEPDAGGRFTKRLRERLSFRGERFVDGSPPSRPELRFVDAARPDGEVREVAARIREALDAGQLPERIGVVARDLTGYRAALRRHFGRLGIPFSGVTDGGVGPRMRQLRALEAMLRDHQECRVERWLDAMAPGGRAVHASDLRLGLRRLGLVRLHELAAHAASGDAVKLPVVAGWWQGDDPEIGETVRAVRRRLHPDALARAVEKARSACARLERLRAEDFCERQLGELSALLREDLDWDPRRPEWEDVHAELEALRGALPAGFALGPADLALLVRRRLASLFLTPLGGNGGGVQVLDATAARGRCFDRLFLIGLSRDAFPRSPREDPLLPDALRERVRELLPEIPIKQLGLDEERFLFAELLGSAPLVTISWPLASEDGRPCARSGFAERLRWGGLFEEPEHARPVLAPGSAALPPLAVEEQLLRAALPGPVSRARLAAVLPGALRRSAVQVLAGNPAAQAEALAQARVAVLREVERGGFRAAPLGPYFGFVGAPRASRDPRSAPLHVTTLERLAACGWQTLLSRLLRMEAPPDAGGALPGIDKRLLGSAVHRALERVFAAPGAGWTGAAELAAVANQAAAEVLEEEGIPLRGLARVLAQQALPFLERARSLDLAETAPLEILAAEGERSIQVADAEGRARTLRFRADRIERIGGRERLTDFKTGQPLSDAKGADTRHAHFLEKIASGRTLQPLAYARSAPDGGEGRLLFLRPDIVDAEYSATRADAELGAAFDSALGGLFHAWDAGSFFPRLLDKDREKEPRGCLYCEVATACLRGDPGARRRLATWLDARQAGEGARPAGAELALLNLFRLGQDGVAEEEGGA